MSSHNNTADIFHPQLPTKPGQTLVWSELYGSSFGLAIVSAAHEHQGPVIVVTEDNRHAQSLEAVDLKPSLSRANAWYMTVFLLIRILFRNVCVRYPGCLHLIGVSFCYRYQICCRKHHHKPT